MKRSMICCICMILSIGGYACGALKVNTKAPDWSLKDADGQVFTMENWSGKVLLVNYVYPHEPDLNDHFNKAMKNAKNQGLLKEETYKGIGIVDCMATNVKPEVLTMIAGAKAKKYNVTILFDYDALLRNSWGLTEGTSNVILLDKNRVIRTIVRGRVSDDQVEKIVKLAIDLQYE